MTGEFMAARAPQMPAMAWRLRLAALWERVLRLGRRPPKRLRLCESLPLGERRFVAVVEFEDARFLVGGTAASLVLLAHLPNAGGGGGGGSPATRNGSAESAASRPGGTWC